MRASAGRQLATVLDGLDLLREVFLQDAVLKLNAYGQQYLQQFPQLSAITQHSAWPAFAALVRQGHAESLERAHPDADKRAAAKALQDCLQTALASQRRSAEQAPLQTAALSKQASVAELTETVSAKRPGDTLLQPGPSKRSRVKPVFSWNLAGLPDLRAAWRAYQSISAVPPSERLWAGNKKEKSASSSNFKRFKDGLAAELTKRMSAVGSEDAALAELEAEMQHMPCNKQYTSLQQLNSRYTAKPVSA